MRRHRVDECGHRRRKNRVEGVSYRVGIRNQDVLPDVRLGQDVGRRQIRDENFGGYVSDMSGRSHRRADLLLQTVHSQKVRGRLRPLLSHILFVMSSPSVVDPPMIRRPVEVLGWTPDELWTDPDHRNQEGALFLKNPLPSDKTICFENRGHRYAIFDPETSMYFEDVMGTTTWIHKYTPPFPAFAAVTTAKSVNSRFEKWIRAGFKHPVPWPEKYLRHVSHETFDKYKRFKMGEFPTLAHAFSDRLSDHTFVRLHPSIRETNMEIYLTWSDLKEKTPEVFLELFGQTHELCFAIPPTYTAADVSNDWPRMGTMLHLAVERYLNGLDPRVTPTISTEFDQFLRFHDYMASMGYQAFRTELSMGDPDLMVCGQADAVYFNPEKKRYILVDWKSTNKIVSKDEREDLDHYTADMMMGLWETVRGTTRFTYCLQLIIYKDMLAKTCGIHIAEMYIVVLNRQNPDFVVIEAPDFSYDEEFYGPRIAQMYKERLEFVETAKMEWKSM